MFAAAVLLSVGVWTTWAAPVVEMAPEIRLRDLEGEVTSVGYGKAAVTLVNFWATWCLPCREEMPQIERLSRKYGPRGFHAVGIALESGGAAEIRDFLDKGKFDLSYTLLVGDDAVGDGFGGVEIVPTTFLVGADGRILSRHLGVTEGFENKLAAEIEKLLAGAEATDGKSAQ